MRTGRRLIKNCHKVDLRAIVHVDLPFYPPKFPVRYFFLKIVQKYSKLSLIEKKINIKLNDTYIFSSVVFNVYIPSYHFEKKKKISCVRTILDSRIFVISGNKNVEWLR